MNIAVDGVNANTRVITDEKPPSSTSSTTAPASPTKDGANLEAKKAEQKIKEKYIEADVEFLPNPYIKVGELFSLSGCSKLYDGIYYVRELTFTMSAEGFTVNGKALRVGDLAKSSNANRLSPTQVKEVSSKSDPTLQVITIKKGDTLGALAKKYSTTVEFLAKVNNISNVNMIVAGKSLKVPRG